MDPHEQVSISIYPLGPLHSVVVGSCAMVHMKLAPRATSLLIPVSDKSKLEGYSAGPYQDEAVAFPEFPCVIVVKPITFPSFYSSYFPFLLLFPSYFIKYINLGAYLLGT
jgi:hypothetical protein